MQKKRVLGLFCAVLMLSLSGCEYEDDFPAGVGEGNIEAIVLNEGRIGTNMGAISVLYRNGMVSPDVFRVVNNRPLGDVAQSITMINGKYFVALNNSKKIEIVDSQTFKSEGTILYTQAGLPRQIVSVSDTTAIVSDLLSNNVSGTDLPSQLVRIRTVPPYGTPLEYIVIRKWVEYMEVADNKLFGMTAKGLYVFDLDNITQEGSRMIEDVYNEETTKTCKMLKDKNGRIWALMNERDKSKLTAVLLKCIDPETEKVITTYRLPFVDKNEAKEGDVVGTVSYNRTDMDAAKTLIYFSVRTCKPGRPNDSQQSIYTLNTDNGTFRLHRHVPGVDMMYGCGVSPQGEVYICDCLDYSAQRGYIRHYKESGNIESYRVGVYPSQVYFPESVEVQ
ncbi:DUF5074 domain-containing protein [Bacteroides oleiciplenus]|uniref:Uncharacterized protein n=2 Tax=Bacteroides oleiciplenus TaxID=626931 RepID=K9E2U6_9BACE|nr:DUF5074 domain-containing protein [Bacteroides oleiciplenus]EKU91359.1 hypothetical protein HMPREF9447_01549 [Bacteroides oleiciplenus YIT 12058]